MLLTPKQKVAYRLHYKQGMPQVEVAKILNVRPESVCRLLARAQERIQAVITECGGTSNCLILDAVLN